MDKSDTAPLRPGATWSIHRPSDQIHVLGSDQRGKYITHALAGRESLPPVRVLTYSRRLTMWYKRHGIVLHNGDETIESRRAILELTPNLDLKSQLAPETRALPVTDIPSTKPGGVISNLIVTVPAESVVRQMAPILHRIRPTTVVCLLSDGLGVMEVLNDACFPRYGDQPLYVLGHMSHVLGKHREPTVVSEIGQGKLYLSGVGHGGYEEPLITHHPPIERNSRVAHFLDIMSTTPRLQAGGYALDKFMAMKLHYTIIRAVLEPLTVVLDCNFAGLVGNSYAKQMVDSLLGEILNVVSRMPELKESRDMRWMMLYGELRRDVYKRLGRLKDSTSRMHVQTVRGYPSDIDFLNGYFVDRGRELGVRCPVNESVIWMVKAKQQQCLIKIRSEVETEPLY